MPLLARLLIVLLCAALISSNTVFAVDRLAPTNEKNAKRSSSATRSTAPKKPKKKTAAQLKKDAEREKWLERLKAREVEPWPENETDEEHETALKVSRKMAEEVVSLFPGTQIHETKHFLFVSNIPPQQVGPYIASLDRMYDYMCQLYGVARDHKVWLGGKALIFAFLEKEQFDAFEERYFPEARETLRTLANVYGLSHLNQSGEVVIACFRGNDPNDFGQMIVHETSHGFIHRYKTKAQLPNWVDEGMADLIGAEMVPASNAVKGRELKAIQQLAQQPSLGGMFSAKRIDAWQYGVASNLNRFLLQTNRKSYVRFIEEMKDGVKWEEALREAYHSTPEQMLSHYSRWVGTPELKP